LLLSLRVLRPLGLAFIASLSMGEAAMAASARAPVEGVWRTKLASEVTIRPCAEGYCGYLSKIVVPKDSLKPGESVENLKPKDFVDARNKDPQLRKRTLLGLKILTLNEPGKGQDVYEGQIYNPEDGNTYAGNVEIVSKDVLRLTGCVLVILCRGEDWVRVR
jgi:uncharacterized protein (DUF2147 family)